jgi:hypothetical protein
MNASYLGIPVGMKPLISYMVIQDLYTEENKHVFEEASPTLYLRRLLESEETPEHLPPPFFITHGTIDSLAPEKDAQVFFNELKKVREKHGGVNGDAYVSVTGG